MNYCSFERVKETNTATILPFFRNWNVSSPHPTIFSFCGQCYRGTALAVRLIRYEYVTLLPNYG